jgi:hypothetical protein
MAAPLMVTLTKAGRGPLDEKLEPRGLEPRGLVVEGTA